MNSGKRFEQCFRKSVPSHVFYYRLKDSSNTWSNGNTRFTLTSACDVVMFDGSILYLLELKSTKGKSLPLKNIKDHQISDLLAFSHFKNVLCGLVIEFSECNTCYFIEISLIDEFKRKSNRMSIPIDYCQNKGIKIDLKRLRVNATLDIDKFIQEIRRNRHEFCK